MAVPKRKTSKARQRSRAANWKLATPGLVPCPHCRKPRVPHRACPHCGQYAGRQVVPQEG